MVADAVGIEPVSDPNSLLTGKFTGNFVEGGALAGSSRLQSHVIPMICSKIPYAVEQGIFLSRTGNWNCRTGKPFAANQGIKTPGPRGLIEEFFA